MRHRTGIAIECALLAALLAAGAATRWWFFVTGRSHHLFECRPYFTRSGTFEAVMIFSYHLPGFTLSIVPTGFELCWNRKIPTSLLIRGHSRVNRYSL